MSDGGIIPLQLEEVNHRIDEKIAYICAEVYSTEPPLLFSTGRTNFRNEIAKKQVYKGTRKSDKPFHWKYVRAYMKAHYEFIEEEGLEADDTAAMYQVERLKMKDTILCSRDKDWAIVPGFHFKWEVAGQPSVGPHWVDKIGHLEVVGNKCKGDGLSFFYYQMLAGDAVDNISGLYRIGPLKSYNHLKDCTTIQELHSKVEGLYRQYHGDDWYDAFIEQGTLLWMCQHRKDDGSVMMWEEELTDSRYFDETCLY